MLRLLSHRLALWLLVALATAAHLSAIAGAAPLPSGLLSVANGELNAPALASKAPQAETNVRLPEPKRFAAADPAGAALPPASGDMPGRDRSGSDALSGSVGPAAAAILSPGQRAPPEFLHAV